MNINDAKIVLKFEVISDVKIRLHLVSIKPQCMYNPKSGNGYGFCSDDVNKFNVWSQGDFMMDRTQLRLPEINSMKGKSSVTSVCKFKSEENRKEILKKLYSALTKWSNKLDDGNDENRVVLDNEYWYVL